MRKRRIGSAPRATSQLVLSDFELYDDRSGVAVTVHARELKDCFRQLARANGFKLGGLLGNVGTSSTLQPLECLVVTRLPAGSGWSFDDSGYISLKLKESSTVRGHTFLGNAGNARDRDDDLQLRLSRSARCSLQSADPNSSPPRQRRSVGPPAWLDGHSLSPGSPASALVGQSQPLPIRLHRAVALALSADPTADSKLLVRHVCGNKRCAVAAHFRFGSEDDNKADEAHHRVHPGCSRQVLSPLQ